MADIASLGIKVTTQGVKEASEQLDKLDKSGKRVEQSATTTSKAFSANAKSAKELAFATRNLPAQFTDIAVGLSTGQRPLQVLLQQGGQIKDIFGGVGPAFAAVGRYLLGLVNPVTIAIGAIAGLGLAWKQAADESAAFNSALILTGRYAGTTADDLEEMARRLDKATTASAGKASEVLATVAATGRFTADQLSLVSEAAIRMQDATGSAIESTIKDFASLKDAPTEAILKLNELGQVQNFLTEETLKAIKELEEQGKVADATAVAAKAYADAINDRAPKVVENLSLFSSLWRTIAENASSAWDVVVQGFRDADREALIAAKSLQRYVNYLNLIPGASFALPDFAQPKPVAQATAGGGGSPIVNTDRAKASIEFEREALRFATQRERMERDIKEARALGLKAGKSELEIEQRVAAIRKSYADRAPKGRKGVSLEGSELRAELQSFRDQIGLTLNELGNAQRLLEERYRSGMVSATEYYKEQRRLVEEGTSVEVAGIQKQIDALQSKAGAGRDAIDRARQVAQLETEIAKIRGDSATKLQILDLQEKRVADEKAESIRAYAAALQLSNDALKAQFDTRVASVSLGQREFEIQTAINDVLRERAERERELALALQRGMLGQSGGITQEQYDADLAALQRFSDERVRIIREGFADIEVAQSDWLNGARRAFADYFDSAKDVAGQTYEIFTNAFRGLEDSIVEFVTTGKATFKEMFDSIAADITRFVVRQQIAKLAEKFLPGLAGKDEAGKLTAAAGALAGSAAPLITAAGALSAAAAALAAAGAGSAAAGGASGGGGFWASLLGAFGGGGFANGGAFVQGRPVEAFAKGGILDKPTFFGMAGGRVGLGGEAGTEAILPLHRGRDGKLGVRLAANDSMGGDVINNTTFLMPELVTRQTQAQVAQRQQQVSVRATSRNRA